MKESLIPFHIPEAALAILPGRFLKNVTTLLKAFLIHCTASVAAPLIALKTLTTTRLMFPKLRISQMSGACFRIAHATGAIFTRNLNAAFRPTPITCATFLSTFATPSTMLRNVSHFL